MNGDLVDEADSFEAEGVEAFNRMTNAMHTLQTRMDTLDTGLASKVAQAEQAASKAETAAGSAIQAAQHAEATAHAGARQTASWAVLGALAGILVAGGAGYWLGHDSGQEIGRAEAYKTAMDEKAAASWANTPTGQLALALDKNGDLSALLNCSKPGWKPTVQNGRRVCFPHLAPDGQYGWLLP